MLKRLRKGAVLAAMAAIGVLLCGGTAQARHHRRGWADPAILARDRGLGLTST
jgi:hypothetical protein